MLAALSGSLGAGAASLWALGVVVPRLASNAYEPLATWGILFGSFFWSAARFLAPLSFEPLDTATLSHVQQLEHLYLDQVKQQIEDAQRHPLHYTEAEIIALEAELIERSFECHLPGDPGHGTRERKWHTRNLVRELEQAEVPIVVLGDPGAGKSVALRAVGLELAARGRAEKHPRLPVYLPLGSFRGDIAEPRQSTLAFIRDSLGRLGGQALYIAEHLEAYFQAGRLVLLLDAMDEMPHQEIERRFAAFRSIQSYRGNKFIFACRKLNFLETSSEQGLSGAFAYQRATIKPFDEAQIRSFLGISLGDRAKAAADAILSPETLLRDMASNPFFLKLFSVYYNKHGALPESRADLLKGYQLLVLDRARRRLGDELPVTDQGFTRVLARLAYLITLRGEGVFIPIDDFWSNLLPDALREYDRLAPHRSESRRVIEIAENEHVLVREVHRDADGRETALVKFHHHRVEEYFTAVYLDQFEPSVNWNEHIDDIWWQEVLIMLFGITSRGSNYLELLFNALPQRAVTCAELGRALGEILKEDTRASGIAEFRALDSRGFYGLNLIDGLLGDDATAAVLAELDPLDSTSLYGEVPFEPRDISQMTVWAALEHMGLVSSRDRSVRDFAPLSPVPDSDEARERVRRWLEDRNRRLLDRAQLTVECLRNASKLLRPQDEQRLLLVVEPLLKGGNSLEIVRAVHVLSRLQSIDLYAHLEPAIFQGDRWTRGEAIEAIAQNRVDANVSVEDVRFILFLQFCKGELLLSLNHVASAVKRRGDLRNVRFIAGVILMAALSCAVAVIPLLVCWSLLEYWPGGAASVMQGIGVSDTGWLWAIATTFCLAMYACWWLLGIPVSRFMLVIAASLLVVELVSWEHLSWAPGELTIPKVNGQYQLEQLTVPAEFWADFVRDSLVIVRAVAVMVGASLLVLLTEWLAVALFAMLFALLWSSRRIAAAVRLARTVIIGKEYESVLLAPCVVTIGTFGVGWLWMAVVGVTKGWIIYILYWGWLAALMVAGVAMVVLASVKAYEFVRDARYASRGVAAAMGGWIERRVDLLRQAPGDVADWIRRNERRRRVGSGLVVATAAAFLVIHQFRHVLWANIWAVAFLLAITLLGLYLVFAVISLCEYVAYIRGASVRLPPEDVFWEKVSKARETKKLRWIVYRSRGMTAEQRIEHFRTGLRYAGSDWVRAHLYKRIDEAHKERRHKYASMAGADATSSQP